MFDLDLDFEILDICAAMDSYGSCLLGGYVSVLYVLLFDLLWSDFCLIALKKDFSGDPYKTVSFTPLFKLFLKFRYALTDFRSYDGYLLIW